MSRFASLCVGPQVAVVGTLATRLVLPPRDPESKGIVERRNGFSPGLAHTDPAGPGLLRALGHSDYSVDPTMIGRIVDVSADLDRVRVRAEGRLMADHARVWARPVRTDAVARPLGG